MPKKPRFGRIYQRRNDGVWWIAYYHHGQETRESTKSYKYSDAEQLLKDRIGDKRGRNISAERTTVTELLDDLLRDYNINGKSARWAQYVNDRLRPFFKNYRAHEVSTTLINQYIEHRKRPATRTYQRKGGKSERQFGPAANATINRELSLLRRAFNLGRHADPPKVERTPRIPKLAEHNVRKGFFEHHQYQALLAALPEELKPILTFAYYTGTRKGEILGLRWNQIDLNHDIVRLEPGETKNNDARVIPLTKDLAIILAHLKQERDEHWPRSPWVFTRQGQRIIRFDRAWNNACQAAGFSDENGKPTKLFHDLRRTGVRNLVRAGVPELIAMRISGHRTRSVFDRYNIVTEDDLQHAVRQLENYLQTSPKTKHARIVRNSKE